VQANIAPKIFWTLTLRQVLLLINQNNHNDTKLWDKVRNLEFTTYNTAFAGMSGERPFKKIKKPSDLYRLPTDTVRLSSIKVDKERAVGDVEQMKKHFKWKKDLINHN
jgi:hypothetical protein